MGFFSSKSFGMWHVEDIFLIFMEIFPSAASTGAHSDPQSGVLTTFPPKTAMRQHRDSEAEQAAGGQWALEGSSPKEPAPHSASLTAFPPPSPPPALCTIPPPPVWSRSAFLQGSVSSLYVCRDAADAE